MAVRIDENALEYIRNKGTSLTMDVQMGSG